MNTFYFSTSFISDHSFLFILAMLTFSFSLFLKTFKLLLAEVAICLIAFVIQTYLPNVFLLIDLLQIGLFLLGAYKLKKAVDYNYGLVLEKTHITRPKLTKNDRIGTRSSFM